MEEMKFDEAIEELKKLQNQHPKNLEIVNLLHKLARSDPVNPSDGDGRKQVHDTVPSGDTADESPSGGAKHHTVGGGLHPPRTHIRFRGETKCYHSPGMGFSKSKHARIVRV